MENVIPAGNNILIEVVEAAKQTKSGVYMPGSLEKSTKRGKIVKVGPGLYSTTGTPIPMTGKEGDTVVYPAHSGTVVRIEEKEYTIISENEVLLFLTDGGK